MDNIRYLNTVSSDAMRRSESEPRGDWHDPPEAGPNGLVDELIALVGNPAALETLDAEPLPDEPFEWSAVEDSDRPFVNQVLELSDRCCDELLDVEFRTIARRLLARVAARDPRPLRRSANADRFAAGLVFLAGNANGEFGRRGRLTGYRLWTWFGVGNCSDRARTLRGAAGLEPESRSPFDSYSDRLSLGDAALLHSRFRAQLCMRRAIHASLKSRRSLTVTDDGRQARVVAEPVKPLVAAKGLVGTRVMMLIGLGEDLEDAHFIALTIPDAHDLARRLQAALDAPAPRTDG